MGSSHIAYLAKFATSEELKAISLFDFDNAGKKAIAEIKDENIKYLTINDLQKNAITIEDLIPKEAYIQATNSFYSKFSWYRKYEKQSGENYNGIIDGLRLDFDKFEKKIDKTSIAREFCKEMQEKQIIRTDYEGFARLFNRA